MPTILETKALTKNYGKFCALNRASITIRQGDIFGLVGKNGAGKTTLMKLITGLTERSEGEIALFGEGKRSERMRTRIGAIVEIPEFFPYFTAEQNLEYFRMQRGIAEPDAVKKTLETVELNDTGKKKFRTFSLGMKQRLGLALALMGSPDFLILDEPSNGIDPEGIVHIRKLLKKLNEERNITILISSHNLTELSNLATRFAIIDRGVILEELTALELEQKSKSRMEIVVDNVNLAAAILEEELGLRNYSINSDNHILLSEGFDRSAEISRTLVNKGLDLHSLAERPSTLEDYFLKTIGANGDA